MMITPELLHYCSAGLPLLLGAIGGGIGLGIAGRGAHEAMERQGSANPSIFRSTIIGLTLIEGSAVIALITTLILLLARHQQITWELAYAELGIALAVGIAAMSVSIASSFVVKAATQAIARQPLFAQKILTFMLISQSIIEAPVLFAFIIAMIIQSDLQGAINMGESLELLAAGIAIALGCIGPCIGQALFSQASCTAIGMNKNIYNKIFPFALLNQAIIETPVIFCMLFSLITLFSGPDLPPLVDGFKHLIAAFTIGIGAIGASIGIGYVASRSCYPIALDPSCYGVVARTSFLAAVFIESSVIYALIIALLLILSV